MKKILLKILGTASVIIALVLSLHCIRQYWNIDPKIWFFVIYGVCIAGVVAISCLLYSVIDYFETHSFSDIMEKMSNLILGKKETIKKKKRTVLILKILRIIYQLFLLVSIWIIIAAIPYQKLFGKDLVNSIVLLIFLANIVLYNISKAIFAKKAVAKTSYGIFAGAYGYLFLLELLNL